MARRAGQALSSRRHAVLEGSAPIAVTITIPVTSDHHAAQTIASLTYQKLTES